MVGYNVLLQIQSLYHRANNAAPELARPIVNAARWGVPKSAGAYPLERLFWASYCSCFCKALYSWTILTANSIGAGALAFLTHVTVAASRCTADAGPRKAAFCLGSKPASLYESMSARTASPKLLFLTIGE